MTIKKLNLDNIILAEEAANLARDAHKINPELGDMIAKLFAIFCAKLEKRSDEFEKRSDELEKYNQMFQKVVNSLFCYDEEFRAGDWIISVKGPVDTSNNTRLVMKYKDVTRVNCIVDSKHVAYDYAFNILVK